MPSSRFLLRGLLAALPLLAGLAPAAALASDPAGRLYRAYEDPARSHWSGTGARPLVVTVWYPAAAGSEEQDWSLGVFRFGRSALDSPFADAARRPLVVLSHGTGGAAAQLAWLAAALVRAGYVVAAPNHHGNTGAEAERWPAGFVLPGERARDIPVLIDRLLADPQLGPHIDAGRIGLAGFSIGGYTVLAAAGAHLPVAERDARCRRQADNPVCVLPPEAGFSEADVRELARTDAPFQAALARDAQPLRDARIRAVYAMAPAFVSLAGPEHLAGVQVPVRFALAAHDAQIVLDGTRQAIAAGLPQASVQVLPQAGHYSFLAECDARGAEVLPELCSEPGTMSCAQLHRQVEADAVAFFQAHLQPPVAGD